jgi:hypothetical protein
MLLLHSKFHASFCVHLNSTCCRNGMGIMTSFLPPAVYILYVAYERRPNFRTPEENTCKNTNEVTAHVSLVPSVPRPHLSTAYLNVLRELCGDNDWHHIRRCGHGTAATLKISHDGQQPLYTARRTRIRCVQINLNCHGRGGDPNV